MSKKISKNVYEVDNSFPNTEIIIEDFSLEFYKHNLQIDKNKKNNDSLIIIENKEISIEVPKKYCRTNGNKQIEKKNQNPRDTIIFSPKRDIIVLSPKARIIREDVVIKHKKKMDIDIQLPSPKKEVKMIINTPKLEVKKNVVATPQRTIYKELSDSVISDNEDTVKIQPKKIIPLKEVKENDPPALKVFILYYIKEFKEKYERFMNNSDFDKITSKFKRTFIEANYKLLFNLFTFVKENGGYLNGNILLKLVVLNDKFTDFIQTQHQLKKVSEIKKLYCDYLSHFYLYDCKKTKIEDILLIDESFINEIPIITCPSDLNKIDSCLKESYKHNIVILRGFTEMFKINEKLFRIEEIQGHFGTQKNHILFKDKNLIGLGNKDQNNIKNYGKESKSMTIDIQHLPKIKNELESKINPLIFNLSKDDVLKYLKNPVPNITNQNLTYNTENCYYGGKDEECRLSHFNLNHGPGDNIWYGIGYSDCEKFRKFIKNHHSVDVYSKDSNWFLEIDFFLKNKINVFYGKQIKGDIVLVSQGCLNWYH